MWAISQENDIKLFAMAALKRAAMMAMVVMVVVLLCSCAT